MFHLQLRQFPHNHNQFNLSDEDIRAFAELWIREPWVVVGERRWSPQQTRLTVMEGPRLAPAQLSMGRGWRRVERRGEDVTRRLLDAARASAAGASGAPSPAQGAPTPAEARGGRAPGREAEQAGGVARELSALLGDGPRAAALLAAWRVNAQRFPGCSPSECLALAEEELASQAASRPR